MSLIATALSALAGPLFDVVDKAVQDKDQAARLKAELQQQLIGEAGKRLQSRMQVILAEANGRSWLQRNWRPLLMVTITAIVANNYLLAPYLGAMFGTGLQLPLPERLWDLMTIGVGGYVTGRSGEKIASIVKGREP
jgi:hypothetical protein